MVACDGKTEKVTELANPQIAKAENYAAGDLDRPAGERWVTMGNALNRAAHGLTLGEKRIVTLAISKIDSRKSVQGQGHKTRLTAAEFAEAYGVDEDLAYKQLQAAGKHLYQRSITFFEQAHKRARKGSKPLEHTRVTMRWVGMVKYHQGEGWIELSWLPELLPHLYGLKKRFTSYQLQQASALRSIYSWRLLELLMRYEKTGWAEYAIEDFAETMNATEKQRKDFNNIRRRIIEPAVKELQQKDGWIINWEPIKAGRRVAKVRFKFARDPQGRLDL